MSYKDAIQDIADGRQTVEEVWYRSGVWSTSERCVLALILGRPGPRPYAAAGDAWRRIEERQRAIVRQHAPLYAAAAEHAAMADQAP